MWWVAESLVGGPVRSRARWHSRRFLRHVQDCHHAQSTALKRLLALSAGSRFHRDHGLSRNTTLSEFRRRVPVTSYDDVAPYIEALKQGDGSALCGDRNPLRMFALSSGTTGDAKFIPVTRQFVADYRRGWSIWGINTFDDHPRLHGLKILQLTSDFDQFRTPGGTPCGNISGLAQSMQSRVLKFKYILPQAILSITDPVARYYTILRLAVAVRDVGLLVTANPSTLVHLAREMDEQSESLLRDIHNGTLSDTFPVRAHLRQALGPLISRPNPSRAKELGRHLERRGRLSPQDVWPELTVIGVWTGGSAGAYLPAVRQAYGDVAIRDHGLSASEGRMTIPFEDHTASGVLDVCSHFFEFIPEDQIDSPSPDTLLAHELDIDQNYYILLTTASGLCRYDIHDVVRCTGHRGTTPVLEFLHKGAHFSSITGEKVTESQVVNAVRTVTEQLSLQLSHYTFAPQWGNPPFYQLLVEEHEFANPAEAKQLATMIDQELQHLNCEYADKRSTGRLDQLRPHLLPRGTWQMVIDRKQSQLGGSIEQYKHPCLKPDLNFAASLVDTPPQSITRAG
ncbi:MAG: GH3 auxin-responsive promoter family protein [Planctomycetaceae bacterium]|nr:GH3 auxin-responsive promoter family protein [Planctomycetaceae bacterium]